MGGPLLAVNHLSVTIDGIDIVDDVSFTLHAGKTLALVGESGCGKSTVGNAVLRMVEPTAGSVEFNGQVMRSQDSGDLHRIRRHMQIIFQDPVSSLNLRLPFSMRCSSPLEIPARSANS